MNTNTFTTEILIIGGGITGVSAAHFLAQAGHEVTLLERRELASEASGLNAGTLWQMGWGTTPDLSSTLSMGSLEIFREVQYGDGYDIEFRQTGALKVIQTQEEWDFAQQEMKYLKSQGYMVEILSMSDAQTIEPELSSGLLGCLYYPLGGSANPVKTTHALAMEAEHRGARLLFNHEVLSVRHLDDARYEVDTSKGTFHSQTLVIAAGPWCRSIGVMLNLDIPVFPVRGQMWSTGPVSYRLFHALGAMESSFYWHRNPQSEKEISSELTHLGNIRMTRHVYGRQTLSGEIIFGGDRQLSESKTPDSDGVEANRKHVLEIFPFLQQFPIQRTWAGLMPFTSNLEPIIGRLPLYENLYIVTGLSSSGFEQGAMAGKLLAECIQSGQHSPILTSADPSLQITSIQ